MIDIRQPNITAQTEKEQLLQMRSYMYQLAQQLQWAFSTVQSGGSSDGGSTAVQQQAAPTGGSGGRIDPGKTFAAVKDLIIKSADIVNAYYDQINTRLEGVYVAQSDFGDYAEQTATEIKANSDGVSQLFEDYRVVSNLKVSVETLENTNSSMSDRVQGLEGRASSVESRVDELYVSTLQTNAYIKTGKLYEDESGMPVYGLEIGQTNDVNGENVFSKFARFSADRLSFYDRNDTEVAYISDYRLYITNAEVTGALTLTNRFKIYYNHGLAFQWIGG